jgi:hypothetical protein
MSSVKCSLCGAPGVNKLSCPLNKSAINIKPTLHYVASSALKVKPAVSVRTAKAKLEAARDTKHIDLYAVFYELNSATGVKEVVTAAQAPALIAKLKKIYAKFPVDRKFGRTLFNVAIEVLSEDDKQSLIIPTNDVHKKVLEMELLESQTVGMVDDGIIEQEFDDDNLIFQQSLVGKMERCSFFRRGAVFKISYDTPMHYGPLVNLNEMVNEKAQNKFFKLENNKILMGYYGEPRLYYYTREDADSQLEMIEDRIRHLETLPRLRRRRQRRQRRQQQQQQEQQQNQPRTI